MPKTVPEGVDPLPPGNGTRRIGGTVMNTPLRSTAKA
jgi:hypothetical protein